MRYIDAFNHFFPRRLWNEMAATEGAARDIGYRMRGIPAVYDIDARLRVLDQFRHHELTQILSLGTPPLDTLGPPDITTRLARLGNEGLAELVAEHPDRFSGYAASLPMNAPDAAAKEAERALTEGGACGLQIHSNVNGVALDAPQFLPIFELAVRHDKPILLHPHRGPNVPDYLTESKSKYEIWWTFGWPFDTSVAMARLVFSGMLDRLPTLKVMVHHLGAMVPYFEGRLGPGMDQLGSRTTDPELRRELPVLKKRPLEYFKAFYADSATFGSRAAMICGLEFYGPDKVLFASDCPFDPEKGPGYIRETIDVLESMDLPRDMHERIAFRNAEQLFGLVSARG